MWVNRSGIYYFQSRFPVTIGYIPSRIKPPFSDIIFLKQIHSAKIINIDTQKDRIGDGLFTTRSGIVLAIKVADCLPIYFFDFQIKMVGILHAGWRGTLKGISTELNRLLDSYYYVFGPAIGPCCYEIGPELARRFESKFTAAIINHNNRYFLDLKAANRLQLKGKELGDLKLCTHCTRDLSSFRRDKDKARRDVAFIRRD
ncbi:hypothetical protein DRP53_09625 [candidate division WOR-3 bacterium]|uniref:Laccase domain-containing protein n=1 Tax=candidate division WOR-3 bacterium TaxID=2052148 RepID=A0A660SDU8_UNCW3|nr:MAG: hypothetical protein DRP53_09625 [candidate division WOR-3 bacterium]